MMLGSDKGLRRRRPAGFPQSSPVAMMVWLGAAARMAAARRVWAAGQRAGSLMSWGSLRISRKVRSGFVEARFLARADQKRVNSAHSPLASSAAQGEAAVG